MLSTALIIKRWGAGQSSAAWIKGKRSFNLFKLSTFESLAGYMQTNMDAVLYILRRVSCGWWCQKKWFRMQSLGLLLRQLWTWKSPFVFTLHVRNDDERAWSSSHAVDKQGLNTERYETGTYCYSSSNNRILYWSHRGEMSVFQQHR